MYCVQEHSLNILISSKILSFIVNDELYWTFFWAQILVRSTTVYFFESIKYPDNYYEFDVH
jgi:hypothetical protein